MPQASRSNQLLTSGFLLFSLLFLILYVLLSPRMGEPAPELPSSYFSNESGGRAAYLVLEQLFDEVERWRLVANALVSAEEHAPVSTLIVMGPSRNLTPSEAQSLDAWMAAGGQLIVAASEPWTASQPSGRSGRSGGESSPAAENEGPSGTDFDYLGRHGFQSVAASSDRPQDENASPLSVGALRLKEGDFGVLAEDSRGRLAGEKRIGQGRLVVVPDALAFSNARLRQSPGNMAWLAGQVGAGRPGRVAFDEYHHGFTSPKSFTALLVQFAASPWGLACLQAAAAGLLYLVGTRRRFGSVLPAEAGQPRDPMSLVEARAGLLRSASATDLSLDLIERYRQRRKSQAPAFRSAAATASEREETYLELLRQVKKKGRPSDADLFRLGRLAGELSKEQFP